MNNINREKLARELLQSIVLGRLPTGSITQNPERKRRTEAVTFITKGSISKILNAAVY